MKYLVVVCLFIVFSFKGISQKTSVKLRYVNFSIETPFSIHCEYFPAAFSKYEYKDWQPTQKQILDSIAIYAKGFKKVDWPNADVRASLTIETNNKKYHYCFDRFGHFTDGNQIYENNRLFNFLKKFILIH
jgi:hypothetical protein